MAFDMEQEESIWLEKQAGTWREIDESLIDYFGPDLDADGDEYDEDC